MAVKVPSQYEFLSVISDSSNEISCYEVYYELKRKAKG